MPMNDYILLGLAQYGLPVLTGVILLASLGGPLPATLLLLTAGTLVAGGDWPLWWVVGLATAAAVAGDVGGYMIGRWGGQPVIARLSRWTGTGGQERIAAAEQMVQRWGGVGIFLSRWFITPLGPVVNLTSGMVRYPLPAFVCFDVAGELVWVLGYVSLGRIFGAQIDTLSTALGNATWLTVGLVVLIGLGGLVWQHGKPGWLSRRSVQWREATH